MTQIFKYFYQKYENSALRVNNRPITEKLPIIGWLIGETD